MSKYHTDQPIQGTSDDPDLLNRSDFASHLAKLLLLDKENDCLTVSIEGEWGCGKTSLINLAKQSIREENKKATIIEYNPWLAGHPESLIQDFLLQFSAQLQLTDSNEAALNASKELIAYSSLFGVAKLIPGAEPWASIVEKVFSRAGKSTKKIAELKKLDLVGTKRKVQKSIEKIDSPIIVIIDDIDRLTPAETFQILRLTKAVADFPGTSFLLAFDPKYVNSVLEANNIANAPEYLDKIIQLRMPMPFISSRGMQSLTEIELKNISENNLAEIFEQDQDRLSWLYNHYFKNLIANPRDLKRIFNHLKFALAQVEGQVCFTDLFALSILSVKAGSIYEHIKKYPEAYIGRRFVNDGPLLKSAEETVESFNDERKAILDSFSEGDRRLIKAIICDLFPLVQGDDLTLFQASDADAEGRVSATQRLHIALHYRTPLGYISDQDILKFISGSVERQNFIEDFINEDAIDRFFELMNIYVHHCKDESLGIIESILDSFQSSATLNKMSQNRFNGLSANPYQQLEWLTTKIIKDNKGNLDLIKSLVGRHQSTPISALVIREIRNTNDSFSINDEEKQDLESIYIDNALNALEKGLFKASKQETKIFHELMYTSSDATFSLTSRFLENEGGEVPTSTPSEEKRFYNRVNQDMVAKGYQRDKIIFYYFFAKKRLAAESAA